MNLYETDEALIAGCLAQERRAWNTFVQRHTRYVYFLIEATRARYGATLSEDAKADLHADIFTMFVEDNARRLRDFEGRNKCTLRSWVRMITIRKTIDHLRRKRHRLISIDTLRATKGFEPADDEPDALDQLVSFETASNEPTLELLTSSLTDADRLLLDLFLVQKLKAKEVASVLQLSVGAVYTRKNRLIERCAFDVR